MYSRAITSLAGRQRAPQYESTSRLLRGNFRGAYRRPLALVRGSVPMCELANLAILSQGIDLLGSDSQTWELSVREASTYYHSQPFPPTQTWENFPVLSHSFCLGTLCNVTISDTFCCGYTLFSFYFTKPHITWVISWYSSLPSCPLGCKLVFCLFFSHTEQHSGS